MTKIEIAAVSAFFVWLFLFDGLRILLGSVYRLLGG
jgi:hypothetical protein